jgi:hypothetical protein
MLSCYQNFFYKGKSRLQFKRPQDEPHTAQYLHHAEIMLSHSTIALYQMAYLIILGKDFKDICL